MKVKKISFPTPLEYIENIDDENIDVFVELDDRYTYVVVVSTYKNIGSQMDEAKSNFLEAGCPFIIVRKLTKEIITKALQAYAEDDAYWLKLYQFLADIDMATFL